MTQEQLFCSDCQGTGRVRPFCMVSGPGGHRVDGATSLPCDCPEGRGEIQIGVGSQPIGDGFACTWCLTHLD
jgi:hypothetical protein